MLTQLATGLEPVLRAPRTYAAVSGDGIGVHGNRPGKSSPPLCRLARRFLRFVSLPSPQMMAQLQNCRGDAGRRRALGIQKHKQVKRLNGELIFPRTRGVMAGRPPRGRSEFQLLDYEANDVLMAQDLLQPPTSHKGGPNSILMIIFILIK